jgi:glycosyltransferase involved in cell wall biosynthesis
VKKIKHLHNMIGGKGGPAGYLGFLSQAIDRFGDLRDIQVSIEQPSPASHVEHSSFSKMLPPNQITEILENKLRDDEVDPITSSLKRWFCNTCEYLSQISPSDCKDFFDCDLLVVHNVFAAGRIAQLCPEETQAKLLLMTHSPTYLSQEVASYWVPMATDEQVSCNTLVQALIAYETFIMRSLRAVVWPCKESQEGYGLWSQLYRDGLVKTLFAETCVPLPIVPFHPSDLRRDWEIQPGQRVALFVGRPHKHKGYHQFLALARSAKESGNSNWVFVHAGNWPEPAYDNSLIRHVGFQPFQGPLYLAADLVLVPNQFSYFDIGALEAIGLGARIAISPTGGHKHLLNVCPGIPSIPVFDEAPQLLLDDLHELYDKEPWRKEQSKVCWENRYDIKHFLRYHLAAYQELLG